MTLLASFVAFALGGLVAQAAPTDGNVDLARKYAPQWRFHKEEKYFASTVEYFLENVDLVDADGKVINANPTVSTVDDSANQGAGLFLATDIDASKNGWLQGKNPANDASAAAAYTFIAPKDNGVVDLYYWIFTPFNAAKDVPAVGRVGDHVGDWERMAVRTVNGEATQVDYHAHSDTGSTVPWAQVPKFDSDARPVGYIANGSHGIWKDAGSHTYVNAVIFQLKDITSDDGAYWDTRDSLVTLDYPGTFSGNLDWLNYKGAWGNQGEDDCWWHIFYDECEVVAGPTGPYRDDVLGGNIGSTKASSKKLSMSSHFSQVLGDAVDSDKSSFTIHLADAGIKTAQADSSHKFLGVKQTCEAVESSEEGKKKREDKKEETTFATTSLNSKSLSLDNNKYTITPDACPEGTKTTSYTLGLCSSESEDSCSFSDNAARPVNAYSKEKGVSGPQDSRAIEVTDLDNWSL